ncbi:MAG: ROK family protein [Candidatus Firestonebacteria bacterium]
MQKKNEYAIGVDLGGTNIAAGIVNSSGKVILREKLPTLAKLGGKAVLGRIGQVIDALLLKVDPKIRKNIKGIGIGTPGLVEHEKGIVREPPNLPGMDGMNIKKFLEKRFKVKAFVANDANAYAVGEHTYGAGKGTKNMVCITLGTGLGGGIIIDGKLYVGSFETAGELGHVIIRKEGKRCLCGSTGCVETYVGANFIADRVRADIKKGKKTSIVKLVNGDLSKINPIIIEKAARQNDKYAKNLWNELGAEIGTALISIVNTLSPEMVVIGGGVSKAGDLLFKPIRKQFQEIGFSFLKKKVKIVPGKLSDDAGVLGSSSLVWNHI